MVWTLTQGAGATPSTATVAASGTTTLSITPTLSGSMLFVTGNVAYANTTANAVVSNLTISDSVDGSWTVVCNNNVGTAGTKWVTFVAYHASSSSTAARTVTLSNGSTASWSVTWAAAEATHVGLPVTQDFTELNNLGATNQSVVLSGGTVTVAGDFVIEVGANGNGTNGTGWTSPGGGGTTLYSVIDATNVFGDVFSLITTNPTVGGYAVTFTDNAGGGPAGFPSALVVAFKGPTLGTVGFGSSTTVLIEGDLDIKRTDHYARVQMFGRLAIASPTNNSMLMLAPQRVRWDLYGDGFTFAYHVTEAYSQAAFQVGSNQTPTAFYYKTSNRVLEDEWPYPKTDHSLINQFRWAQVGILYPYSFELPDLTADPWLEWVHPPTDHALALMPFRGRPILGTPYQPSLVFWKPRFPDLEAERDIDRQSPHSLRLLLFGHVAQFIPVVQAPYVMDSMWRADQLMTADTTWYLADGVDIHNGGGVDQQSGLRGDVTKGPIVTESAVLPL